MARVVSFILRYSLLYICLSRKIPDSCKPELNNNIPSRTSLVQLCMTSLKFLTGAPDGKSLDWHESGLLNDFVPAIRRHLDGTQSQEASEGWTDSSIVPSLIPKWRSIEVNCRSKDRSSITEIPETEERLEERRTPSEAAEFLQHSLAVFEGLDTQKAESHHSNDADTTLGDTTFGSASMSFMTGGSASLLDEPSNLGDFHPAFNQNIQLPPQITNLRKLPSASHIQAIQPQTISVNLIVGIISVSPLRTIQLKRFQRHMEILELLVGDETSAAFSITVWLASTADVNSDQVLREVAMALRPGDIVCIQNIALNVFRRRVYGQSLSRRISRAETKVLILGKGGQVIWHQLNGGGERTELVEKLKRVEEWAHHFLCSPGKTRPVKGDVRDRRIRPDLPPDTQ